MVDKGHFPKGKPRAPGAGRKKGIPNKATVAAREMFKRCVDLGSQQAFELWLRVAKKNPAEALRLLTAMADFCIPRLSRVEVAGDPDAPVQVWTSTKDPALASAAYSALMSKQAPLPSQPRIIEGTASQVN